jgi:hypothetical protein
MVQESGYFPDQVSCKGFSTARGAKSKLFVHWTEEKADENEH